MFPSTVYFYITVERHTNTHTKYFFPDVSDDVLNVTQL